MTVFFLLVVMVFPSQQGAVIQQHSSGWCSPNIVAGGSVTVNCIGVDPRALRALNQKLIAEHLSREKAKQALLGRFPGTGSGDCREMHQSRFV